jgi:uncharacterized membrane protein YagU involved in acid resistance
VNWWGAILSGLVATVVLTTLMSGSQALRLTRISLPFMLGTMFTPDRDLAKLIGFVVHFINGWWIALVYAALFQYLGQAGWLLGAILGLVHGMFVLVAVTPVLPGLHPRMASEQRGPTPTRQLEPPGFFALNYGERTPVTIIFAHIVYGALLGGLYRVV